MEKVGEVEEVGTQGYGNGGGMGIWEYRDLGIWGYGDGNMGTGTRKWGHGDIGTRGHRHSDKESWANGHMEMWGRRDISIWGQGDKGTRGRWHSPVLSAVSAAVGCVPTPPTPTSPPPPSPFTRPRSTSWGVILPVPSKIIICEVPGSYESPRGGVTYTS